MTADATTNRDSSRAAIVALTGFMGAGKSTIGRALARRLKWQFIDLDEEIERRCGASISEIFTEHGELHFRQLEAEALQEALSAISSPSVLALGGGTFIQPDNAARLNACGAQVIFLELPVSELLRRCRVQAPPSQVRPLAADDKTFRALYERRLPAYRRAALTVQVTGKTAPNVAREIIAALRLAARD